MFGLFKKKGPLPTFAPLVRDMHSHLLPLVDDGSKSVEESIEVMEAMKETGFEEICLTPHFQYPRFPNNVADLQERYAKFLADVEVGKGDRQLPRMVGCTGEYRIDDGFQGIVERNELRTYHFSDPKRGSDKGLLLIEFSLNQKRMGLEEVVFNLQMDGYDIILAHPERYVYMGMNDYRRLHENGIDMQLNLMSLTGHYGPDARAKALRLLKEGFYSRVGTDLHRLRPFQHAIGLKCLTHQQIALIPKYSEFQ